MRDAVDEAVEYYRVVSRFIDLECRGRGDEAFWARVVADRAAEVGPPRVLELGAGTGRITAWLAREAAEVVAIDVSPEMLARARSRVLADARIRLVATDMRRPGVGGGFDLVVAPNDPFTHLLEGSDRDAALGAAAERLRPGGRFVLDAHWLPPDELARACCAELERERAIGVEDGEEIRVRESWRCTRVGRRCTARYVYSRGGRQIADASFHARLWSTAELETRFAAFGLEPRIRWGGYDRSVWSATTARRLVIEARRR